MPMLTRTRLDKCKLTILPYFRFLSSRICVSKILNCNFLLLQLQIAVILLLSLPLNPESLSLFFSIRPEILFIAVPVIQLKLVTSVGFGE